MRCIISLANERGNYLKALDRLEASVKEYNPEIPFFGFRSEEEVGATKHLDNPYAFKIYAFNWAKNHGYNCVLWLDSSVVLRKDITPVFEEIERDGHIMQEAGCYVGEWTNDRALDYFGLSRDEAMVMLCYGNAGFLGLNFDFIHVNHFFDEWEAAMYSGLFKGLWDNDNFTESKDPRCKGHRHDLSVGSIIAKRCGMEFKKGDEWLQYSAPDAPLINETILLSAQGL